MATENNGVLQVANIANSKGGFDNPQRGRVYDVEGIAPTIVTVTGGGLEPKILQHDVRPCAMRGRENGQRIEFNETGCANALTTVQKDSLVAESYRIRKLTPRECFRLMGVTDAEIDTIQTAGISNSQQYKMAGNSIVVDVLAKIFEQLFRFNN